MATSVRFSETVGEIFFSASLSPKHSQPGKGSWRRRNQQQWDSDDENNQHN
jgi:hypothetical protein